MQDVFACGSVGCVFQWDVFVGVIFYMAPKTQSQRVFGAIRNSTFLYGPEDTVNVFAGP